MDVELLNRLRWLGHDSFLLEGPVTIYIDPWHLSGDLPPADIVLVSHEHGDHCSPQDVAKVQRPDTVVLASQNAAPQLKGAVRIVRPGDEVTIGPPPACFPRAEAPVAQVPRLSISMETPPWNKHTARSPEK